MAEQQAVAQRVAAGGNVRLEPTALPTSLHRLGRTVFGWHPVIVPARVAA